MTADLLPVPGYKASVRRGDWVVIGWRGRPLTVRLNSWNKPVVDVYSEHGRKRTVGVGRLVLLAVAGPPPLGRECCHSDDDQWNNDPSNLYWGTHRENMADRSKNGKTYVARGAASPSARLNAEQVRWIREQHAQGGVSYKALGRQVGVSGTMVSRIVRGVAWC